MAKLAKPSQPAPKPTVKAQHSAKGGLVCAHKSVATKLCNGGKVG